MSSITGKRSLSPAIWRLTCSSEHDKFMRFPVGRRKNGDEVNPRFQQRRSIELQVSMDWFRVQQAALGIADFHGGRTIGV